MIYPFVCHVTVLAAPEHSLELNNSWSRSAKQFFWRLMLEMEESNPQNAWLNLNKIVKVIKILSTKFSAIR